ncbi:MAG: CBS domain-containing protein [Leptospiraceae bacterium]|nr:CBS domain-containing protein [Leptospiraceae bacterium]MCP5494141.1 CBS domain-containing protein [Leptospiraceae bacterium]
MKTVGQLLQIKGSKIFSITPDSSVYKALEVMAEKDVGALLVVENEKLVGVFSERDYARKIILKGKSSKDTSVGEMMTKTVFYTQSDKTMEDCMAVMTNKKIRHLPVLENEKLIGIITIGDVVNQLLTEHKSKISLLEDYITSR